MTSCNTVLKASYEEDNDDIFYKMMEVLRDVLRFVCVEILRFICVFIMVDPLARATGRCWPVDKFGLATPW